MPVLPSELLVQHALHAGQFRLAHHPLPSPLHEARARLVEHAAQAPQLLQQHSQQHRIQPVLPVLDDGLLRQHNVLGHLRVGGQQSPINKRPVTQIGVVRLLRRVRQHQLDELLGPLARLFQEQLDRSRHQLQLHHARLLRERLQELLEDLVRVVDTLCVLPDDPHHRRPRLRLVQRVEILAQRRNNALVPVRVPPEDVLDHDDGLLDDVAHARLDQLDQHVDAPLRCRLDPDRTPPNRPHRSTHEVDVHLGRVLFQLEEHLVDRLLPRQLHHNLQLLDLHVDRVVVLAEEHPDLVFEHLGHLLDHQIDAAKGHVLDLRLCTQQGHQRRRQLLRHRHRHRDVLNQRDILEDHLDGREHHRRVGVLQPGNDPLDNRLCLLPRSRLVPGHRVQNEHLAPLGTLVQRPQQLCQRPLVQERRATGTLLSAPVVNLAQRRHRIGHHHRIRVPDQVQQRLQKPPVLHQLGIDIVQLGHTHRGRLPHVRIGILQAPLQRVAQVLCDPVHPDAAHRPHGQRPDQRVWVLRILDKRVDREDRQLWLRLGVVDQVQVDQLLQLRVVRLHTVDHIREQRTDVLPHRHGGDDLLDLKNSGGGSGGVGVSGQGGAGRGDYVRHLSATADPGRSAPA